LEKEFGDVSRLRTDPVVTKTYSSTKKLLENPKDVVGFFLPQKAQSATDGSDLASKVDSMRLSSSSNADDQNPKAPINAAIEENRETAVGESEIQEPGDAVRESDEHESDAEVESDEDQSADEEDRAADEADEEQGEEDDESGWITPGNVQSAINKARRDEGGITAGEEGKAIEVACISTDFAVQNVLLHMGLRLTSIDGMLIKRLRTYVLRCFGCFKTTSIMTKRFCPECGNPTLKKVAVTVNPETGLFEYHLSKRKRISTRGTKFSLPTFKGGKHSSNPVLSADQPMAENRLSKKALQRLDVLDPDYMARDSPFLMKDVTSRSAVIGVRGLQKTDGRRNPNDWKSGRKRGGKKR
jgi:RNA-binding protein NOB1